MENGKCKTTVSPGDRFGKLCVVETKRVKGGFRARVACDCGAVFWLPASHLTSGIRRSCGCFFDDNYFGGMLSDNKVFNTNFGRISKKTPARNNTSGHTGVSQNKKTGLWHAYISVHYRHIRLGEYAKYEDAVAAREAAERKYFDPLLAQRAEMKQ